MVARTVLLPAGLVPAGLVPAGLAPAALGRLGLAVVALLLLAMSDGVPRDGVRLLSMLQDLYRPPADPLPWRVMASCTARAARTLGAAAPRSMMLSRRAKALS